MGPNKQTEYLYFNDHRLGELRAKLDPLAPLWCSWNGRFTVKGHAEGTWLQLPGDSKAPRLSLLEKVYSLLDGLDELYVEVDVKIKGLSGERSIRQYTLSSISVWDETDELLLLEFSPLEQPESDKYLDLEFCWPGTDEFTNHHVRIRPTLAQIAELHQEQE